MGKNKALIVVDVQHDFVEGGALGVTGGNVVAREIARYIDREGGDYQMIVFSQDWHDSEGDNGGHFAATRTQPDYVGTWPRHCVAGSHGAELLDVLHPYAASAQFVRKGQGKPAYSAFESTTVGQIKMTLAELLDQAGIEAVDVVGIATDYCVKATALDAVKNGYETAVLLGLTAGVAEETSVAAVAEMTAAGVSTGE